MAKKAKAKKAAKEKKPEVSGEEAKLPKEMREKLAEMKSKLEKFKKSLLDKFEKYIVGIALLPPSK